MSRIGGSDWPGKNANYLGYPFRPTNYCGLQDSLFWELSNIATLQGKLAKKTEVGRKQEAWREGWYILVKRQLWVFPIPPATSTGNNAERNDSSICPVYYHLGGDASRGITMVYRIDANTFSVVINNHTQYSQQNFQVFTSAKTSMTKQTQTLTFHTKSSEETSLWIEKLSKALHSLHTPIFQHSSPIITTDYSQDNDILGSIDFMIEQSQSEQSRLQVRYFEEVATLARALSDKDVREGFEKFLNDRRPFKQLGRLWLCWQYLADLALYDQYVGLVRGQSFEAHPRGNHRQRKLASTLYLHQSYLPLHVKEWLCSLFHHFLSPLLSDNWGEVDNESNNSDSNSSEIDGFLMSVAFQSTLRRLQLLLSQLSTSENNGDTAMTVSEILLLLSNVQESVWQQCSRVYKERFLSSNEGYDLLVLRDVRAAQDLSICPDECENNENEPAESEERENATTPSHGSTKDTVPVPHRSSTTPGGGSSTAILSWITSSFRSNAAPAASSTTGTTADTSSDQRNAQASFKPHPVRDSVTRWRESLWQAYNRESVHSPHIHMMAIAMTSMSEELWWQLVSLTAFSSHSSMKKVDNYNLCLSSSSNPSQGSTKSTDACQSESLSTSTKADPMNSTENLNEHNTALDWLPTDQDQWLKLYSSPVPSESAATDHPLLSLHLPPGFSSGLQSSGDSNNSPNLSIRNENDEVNYILDDLLACELAYYAQDYTSTLHHLANLRPLPLHPHLPPTADISSLSLLSALAHTQLRNPPGVVLLASNMKVTYCPPGTAGLKEDGGWSRRSFSGETGATAASNSHDSGGGYVRGGSFSSTLFRASPKTPLTPSVAGASTQNNYDAESDLSSRRPSLSGGHYSFPPEPPIIPSGPLSQSPCPFPPGNAQRLVVLLCVQFGVPVLCLCDPVRGTTRVTLSLFSPGLTFSLAEQSLYSFTFTDCVTGTILWQFSVDTFEDFSVSESLRITFTRWCYWLGRLGGVFSPPPFLSAPDVALVVKRGYLQKRGRVNTAYKWRYVELGTDGKMRYYHDHEATRQYKGLIDLQFLGSGGGEVIRRDKEVVLSMAHVGRTWYLRAEEAPEAVEWVAVIEQLVAWRAFVAARAIQRSSSPPASSSSSFFPSNSSSFPPSHDEDEDDEDDDEADED